MKCAFVLAFALLQFVLSAPAPESPCELVFQKNICDQFKNAGEAVQYDFPGPPGGNGGGHDKEILEGLLMEKLKFLKNIGLLKHIPFLGQIIHDIVERDPEGVSKALSGGIFAVLGLVTGQLG